MFIEVEQCIPFFGTVLSRHGIGSDPAKVKALIDMPPPKTKREHQLFLGIVKYLSTFSPMTAEVCKPFRRLTSINAAWTWNRLYLETFEKKINHWLKENTVIPGKRHIRCRHGHCITAGKGQPKLWI